MAVYKYRQTLYVTRIPITRYTSSNNKLHHIGGMNWFYFLWNNLPPVFNLVSCAEVLGALSLQSACIQTLYRFLDSHIPYFLKFVAVHSCSYPWCTLPESIDFFTTTLYCRRFTLDLRTYSRLIIVCYCFIRYFLVLILLYSEGIS